MGEFRMPSLGADMTAGILVAWRIKAGDRVKRGDVIAEVETDKGLFEVEVFEDGVVDQILVQPGRDKLPVGTVLAKLLPETVPAGGVRPAAEERVKVSPAARKLADELGIELKGVQGSGPHGTINLADIERAAQRTKAAKETTFEAAVPKTAAEFHSGMRRAIAAAMSRSNRDIPHYYLETDIDMSCALRWMEGQNRGRSIKERLLPAVVLLKAVARALEKVPELNGFWIDNRQRMEKAIHIGFAIALRQGGLMTPALHNVERKSLDQLMADLGDLVGRTRAGRLRASEMTDATITVTSLGDLGVQTVYGVIYPPQVALVGFGRISERPWAKSGLLGVRPVLTATLAADHRATDGHHGARFLDTLSGYLQEPEKL